MQRKEGQWSRNIEPDSIFSTYTCDFNFTYTYMFQKICYTGLFFSMIQSFSQIRSRQTLQISWYKTDTQIISTCFIITLIDFFFFLIFIKCLKLLISCCWFFQDLFGCCKCKTYSYEIHIYSYNICNYKCTRFQ